MLKEKISDTSSASKALVLTDTDRSSFAVRHIGPSTDERSHMLNALNFSDIEAFTKRLVPESIRDDDLSALPASSSEEEALAELHNIASQNEVYRSYIGLGYYGTHTPPVILRNIFENPAWYTAYTPYQPEISQGRLEALLNFQTMVCEITDMNIANASMLDEATACAEAMALCARMSRAKSKVFFVDEDCMLQTLDVIRTRAEACGLRVEVGSKAQALENEYFGVLLATPGASGEVVDVTSIIDHVHSYKGLVTVTTDLLACSIAKTPGSMGADVVVGNTQRFGVPLGCGGPHAAFMATTDKLKRSLPGRIVGVSVDRNGDVAYRLALQTREQHIRREKATSNICTAQVLLAVMAGMYAVYHGPSGLQRIANNTHRFANRFAATLKKQGFELHNKTWFDTITVRSGDATAKITARADAANVNLRLIDDGNLAVAFDQTCTEQDLHVLTEIFCGAGVEPLSEDDASEGLPANLLREDVPLKHPVFYRHRSETDMLRYLRMLSDKDIALDRSMIPLGSCTMKLNATAEMIPVTWPEFSKLHPFAPVEQTKGYAQMIDQLEQWLCTITGLRRCIAAT